MPSALIDASVRRITLAARPLAVIAVALLAFLVIYQRAASPRGTPPDLIDGRSTVSVRNAIETPGRSLVRGYVHFTSGCGRVPGEDSARCTGLQMSDRSIADPWYAGSTLQLRADDPEAFRKKVLMTGGPTVAAVIDVQSTSDVQCDRDGNQCTALAEVLDVVWTSKLEPLTTDSTNSTVFDSSVLDTPVRIPATWQIETLGEGEWLLRPPSSDRSIHLSRLTGRIPFDTDRGVIDTYPEAHVIAYESGKTLRLWRVESGVGPETRQTLVGFDDGTASYELVLLWGEDTETLRAIVQAPSNIAAAMLASDTEGGD
jgi:hypothetical protein